MENDIQKRIDERIRVKDNQRSETQLSIQLGQALNLAVEVMCRDNPPLNFFEDEDLLNRYVNFFMSYLDKKRKEVFDQNERAYKENPAPIVEQYEAMNPVQKAFLKDKQLEKNRANYAVNKNKTPEEIRMERVVSKQKAQLVNFKELNMPNYKE